MACEAFAKVTSLSVISPTAECKILTLTSSVESLAKLVLIAFIPAALFAWFVVDNWLSAFAYRVEINPLIFVGSGILALLVAWLTVSFQSIKAAASNPVNALRYE